MISEDLFTIYGVTFKTMFVFFFASLIVFLFVFWVFQKKMARDEDSFDVAFIGMVIAVFIGRTVGFFTSLGSYSAHYVSINPFYDINGKFDLFSTIPWAFLKIWDGNFYFPIFGFALLVGIWLVSKARRNFVRARIAIDNAAIAIIFGQIIMDIGLFLTGKLNGIAYSGILSYKLPGEDINRFPLYIADIALLAFILFIIFRTKASLKYGLTTAYYLLIYGVGLFLLRFLTAGYQSMFLGFDYGHIIAAVVVLFSLLFFLRSKEDINALDYDDTKFTRMKRADLKGANEIKPSFAFSPNRRNMDYNKPSFGEKVTSIFKKK